MKFWKLFRIVSTVVFVLALVLVFLFARQHLNPAYDDNELTSAPVIVR